MELNRIQTTYPAPTNFEPSHAKYSVNEFGNKSTLESKKMSVNSIWNSVKTGWTYLYEFVNAIAITFWSFFFCRPCCAESGGDVRFFDLYSRYRDILLSDDVSSQEKVAAFGQLDAKYQMDFLAFYSKIVGKTVKNTEWLFRQKDFKDYFQAHFSRWFSKLGKEIAQETIKNIEEDEGEIVAIFKALPRTYRTYIADHIIAEHGVSMTDKLKRLLDGELKKENFTAQLQEIKRLSSEEYDRFNRDVRRIDEEAKEERKAKAKSNSTPDDE